MVNKIMQNKLLNLKNLIILLAFSVAFITLTNGFYANYRVQKSQLIKHSLDTNHSYAQKLAAATDNFIIAAHQQLAFAARIIEKNLDNQLLIMSEAERIHLQTASFNSVTIVNNQGFALATSPNTLGIIGKKLQSIGAQEALKAQKPMISTPYISTADNFLILVSSPLFSKEGKYLGYVGGTIYLKEKSILNDLLGKHFHKDGSYIYVVDKNKRIIYHPNPKQVGSYIENNEAINSVTKNISGSAQVTNSLGIEMLAGFSPITTTNWGVVAQRPVTATLSSLDDLMKRVVYRTLPLALFTFFIIWLFANYISRPLRQLATTAKEMDSPNAHTNLTEVNSWYFESKELKQAMLKGLGLLNTQINQLKQDAATDPLTGVFNRRSLQLLLKQLEQKGIPFSVLAVDIDHFKKVNDTFGHAAGDKALIELTQMMRQISREEDLVARTGGEEFLLILPNTTSSSAQAIAERLRKLVAQTQIEPIGSIQVSIGIATSLESNFSTDLVLAQADQALYQAKKSGRNRCIVFSPTV
ncbi:MAG TPA: sensor domain-containing diguanylate cyclase [Marinospirillum sp.]|uniref:sensor domain-containing diguanylate cyclase n=1 Tax=Marinospirillum sp. TaxID=2183934 RepID=UPI002B4907B7|nr:sensor domain-containing diguanylate cyclase [Marinospirillum sp.]HKM16281.1 sensor domain-containing diguanylate cyclase [Marinospirillum sp.]